MLPLIIKEYMDNVTSFISSTYVFFRPFMLS